MRAVLLVLVVACGGAPTQPRPPADATWRRETADLPEPRALCSWVTEGWWAGAPTLSLTPGGSQFAYLYGHVDVKAALRPEEPGYLFVEQSNEYVTLRGYVPARLRSAEPMMFAGVLVTGTDTDLEVELRDGALHVIPDVFDVDIRELEPQRVRCDELALNPKAWKAPLEVQLPPGSTPSYLMEGFAAELSTAPGGLPAAKISGGHRWHIHVLEWKGEEARVVMRFERDDEDATTAVGWLHAPLLLRMPSGISWYPGFPGHGSGSGFECAARVALYADVEGKVREIGFLHERTRFATRGGRVDEWVEVTPVHSDVLHLREDAALLARTSDIGCPPVTD